MQQKILSELIQVIPKESPRLNLKIYTRIFEHLIEIKDYKSFKIGLVMFPLYVINHDELIQ